MEDLIKVVFIDETRGFKNRVHMELPASKIPLPGDVVVLTDPAQPLPGPLLVERRTFEYFPGGAMAIALQLVTVPIAPWSPPAASGRAVPGK